MASLNELNLSNNQFFEFPKAVCNVPNLITLRFDQRNGKKVSSLPEEIGNLKVKELIVSYNTLRTFPNSISGMSNLTHLYADHNEIWILPDSICEMQKLQLLHLNNNNLTTLPRDFDQLILLRDLRLYENQLKVPPMDVCVSGVLQPIGLFLRKAFKREGLVNFYFQINRKEILCLS